MCMYHQQFKKSTTISIFKNWANFHGFTRASSASESDHQHYYYSTYATNYTASYTFSSAFWVNQGHYSDYSTIVLLDYYMCIIKKTAPQIVCTCFTCHNMKKAQLCAIQNCLIHTNNVGTVNNEKSKSGGSNALQNATSGVHRQGSEVVPGDKNPSS